MADGRVIMEPAFGPGDGSCPGLEHHQVLPEPRWAPR